MMEADQVIRTAPGAIETLTAEDFETASIHSAAPSYTSEAPSYHSSVPNNEAIPAYSPPARQPPQSSPATSSMIASDVPPIDNLSRANSAPATTTTSTSTTAPRVGLPPVPNFPVRRRSDLPDLMQFRIPLWSTLNENPTARHYQRVAHRRVAAAASTEAAAAGIRRIVLGRIDENPDAATAAAEKPRPLEDPYLVGEDAARKARAERLARENGDEVLIREDRRWDWFLAQMKDWDERGRRWKQFRDEVESGQRGSRLARRIRA